MLRAHTHTCAHTHVHTHILTITDTDTQTHTVLAHVHAETESVMCVCVYVLAYICVSEPPAALQPGTDKQKPTDYTKVTDCVAGSSMFIVFFCCG